MKVTVRETEDQTFEPFDLVIRVESKAELAALWLALNMSWESIVGSNAGCHDRLIALAAESGHTTVYDLWDALDDQWKERCK